MASSFLSPYSTILNKHYVIILLQNNYIAYLKTPSVYTHSAFFLFRPFLNLKGAATHGKTRLEKIEDLKTEMVQLENKRKKLIQEQKTQERKDRTKRLCQRMGLFESLLPDTIPLTEEQFKTFLEKTITTEHSRRILDGLTAQNATISTPQSAEIAALGNSTIATETAHTGQENCADVGED